MSPSTFHRHSFHFTCTEKVLSSPTATIPISSSRATDDVIYISHKIHIMQISGHNCSFIFVKSMQKEKWTLQRVLTNEQLGPLVPRVSSFEDADLEQRPTGEMRRVHSNTDFRPLPHTSTRQVSSPGKGIVFQSLLHPVATTNTSLVDITDDSQRGIID